MARVQFVRETLPEKKPHGRNIHCKGQASDHILPHLYDRRFQPPPDAYSFLSLLSRHFAEVGRLWKRRRSTLAILTVARIPPPHPTSQRLTPQLPSFLASEVCEAFPFPEGRNSHRAKIQTLPNKGSQLIRIRKPSSGLPKLPSQHERQKPYLAVSACANCPLRSVQNKQA